MLSLPEKAACQRFAAQRRGQCIWTPQGNMLGSHYEGHMADHRSTEVLTFESRVGELGFKWKHRFQVLGEVTITAA